MAVAVQTALLGATIPSTSARKLSSVGATTRRHALHTPAPTFSLALSSSERHSPAAPSSRPCSPVAALRAQRLGESGASKQGPYALGSRSDNTEVSAASAAASVPAVHQESAQGGSEGGLWSGLLRLLLDTVVDPKEADSAPMAAESASAYGDECSSNSSNCNAASTVPGHGHVGSRAQRCASSRGSSLQYLFGTLLFATGLYLSMQDAAFAADTHQASSTTAAAAAALSAGAPADVVGSTLALALVPGMPGAEGPFWDNVLRFVVYFITVFTGGLYTLLKPVYEFAKNPVTLLLLIVVVGGGFSFLYFALSAMLGLNDPVIEYNL